MFVLGFTDFSMNKRGQKLCNRISRFVYGCNNEDLKFTSFSYLFFFFFTLTNCIITKSIFKSLTYRSLLCK